MSRGFSEIVSTFAAAATPTALGVVGALALAAPFNFLDGLAPTPIFALYPIFFWSLYGPERMPAPAVFGVGIVQDLILGGPVGLWAMAFLLAHAGILWQREFFLGRSFSAVWTGFGFAAGFAAFIAWICASALYGRPLAVWPIAFQTVATILTYPVFHGLVRLVVRRAATEM